MVVALLVLMALIATAFIVSARADRASAAQHVENTEVDVLAQGVVNASVESLANNLYAYVTVTGGTTARQFRPDLLKIKPPAAQTNTPYYNADNPWGYNNSDGLGTVPATSGSLATDPLQTGSVLIADRIPSGRTAAANARPMWKRISANPIVAQGVTQQFETPYVPTGGDQKFNGRTYAVPDFIELTLPSGETRKYPALRFPSDAANPTGGLGDRFLAADTDGDGIADAALFRLPFGPVNGVTYYAAVRILDNGSAVNASIAMKTNDDFIGGGWQGSVLPTNIDLLDFVSSSNTLGFKGAGDDLELLYGYKIRSNTAKSLANAYNNKPLYDGGVSGPNFTFGSPYAALWSMLGARMGNPGMFKAATAANPSASYRGLPLSAAMGLARSFGLVEPDGSASLVEQLLPKSTFGDAAKRTAFAPDAYVSWFETYYQNDVPNARSYLVARNPVSTFAPGRFRDMGAYATGSTYLFGDRVTAGARSYVCIDPSQAKTVAPAMDSAASVGIWSLQPWKAHPTKISANTGTLGQLWAGYWAVMGRHPFADPGNPRLSNPGERQFKSPIRDSTIALTFEQMRELRSALAAINTVSMRKAKPATTAMPITNSRTVILTDPNGATPYQVNIFSNEIHPYISESVVQSFNTGKAYVAVELYNPYSFSISVEGIRLAHYAHTTKSMTEITYTAPAATMGAHAHWIFVSSKTDAPADLVNVTGDKVIEVADLANLATAGDKELYVLRSRNSMTPPGPFDQYNEANLEDLVPLDQLYFRNIYSPYLEPPTTLTEYRWHYSRPANNSSLFKCVFPGDYTIDPSGPANTSNQGWKRVQRDALAPKTPAGPGATTIGKDKTAGTAARIATIHLADKEMAGPEATGLSPGTTNPRFPFGGFFRPGDILQVPFISPYTIRAVGTSPGFVDMLSVTMDSVFAEDSISLTNIESGDDNRENIGRFCPLVNATGNDDFSAPTAGNDNPAWRYNFALDLFDYFDIYSPQDDNLPNAPLATASDDPRTVWTPAPVGIANGPLTDATQASLGTEDASPLEGRININTADWHVLAALRLVNSGTQNVQLAKAIVRYRDVDDGSGRPHGPFRSIWELVKVPAFNQTFGTHNGDFNPNSDNPAITDGDFTTDSIGGDFEGQFMALTRVSGMITTRSDYFTGYVIVQGWRNAGTPTPELAVQRRLGFIADRSTMTPLLQGGSEADQHTPMKVTTFSND